MSDIEFAVKDERTITIPPTADPGQTEQIGKFLVNAGQDGYSLKEVVLVQRDKGSQREPWLVTEAVKITVAKS